MSGIWKAPLRPTSSTVRRSESQNRGKSRLLTHRRYTRACPAPGGRLVHLP